MLAHAVTNEAPSHHLKTDGKTEVTNKSLGNLLRSLIDKSPKQWDLTLPHVEFTFNMSLNHTTSKSSFKIVYGRNPITPLDLAPIPIIESDRANKNRKQVLYKESDLVWIHLHKERFLAGRFGKLKPRADGPFWVLKKINENAYKIELPNHYDVSATFNVVDLSPYKGCSEYETYLRSSLSEKGEDDPGNDIANMLSSYFAEVHSTKGVDWREHPDPRCLFASAIVHPTRNSSSNSPGLQEHHLE
ncbi:RNA-directed DNA polymerase [Tanacetum coccineum]